MTIEQFWPLVGDKKQVKDRVVWDNETRDRILKSHGIDPQKYPLPK